MLGSALCGGVSRPSRNACTATAGAPRASASARNAKMWSSLECTPPEDAQDTAPDADAIAELARGCATDVADRADPRFYTTTDAIADLDAVREAIGAQTLNLVGGSYGTRVAQQYAARFPERVRSIVLDGVAPNDLVVGGEFAHTFEDAIRSQSQQCQQLAACRKRFPKNAHAQLESLVARLGDGL